MYTRLRPSPKNRLDQPEYPLSLFRILSNGKEKRVKVPPFTFWAERKKVTRKKERNEEPGETGRVKEQESESG